MKTIDKIRSTHGFNIGANHIEYLTILREFFGDGLIAVAYDETDSRFYTVRVAVYENHMPVALVDNYVRIPIIARTKDTRVEIIETTVIHDWTKAHRDAMIAGHKMVGDLDNRRAGS